MLGPATEIDNEDCSPCMNHPNSEKTVKDMSDSAGVSHFSAVEIQEHQLETGNAKETSCLFHSKIDEHCRWCWDILPPTFLQKIVAEIIATFILVFVTCGSSMLNHSSDASVSKLGSSVASGLIVTVMIYSVGHISGAHMNPAVTIAFATVRHFPWKQIGELAGIAVGSTVMISSIFAGPISGGSMNPARSIGPAVASNNYKDIWVYVIGPIVGTILGAWSYSLIRLTRKPWHASSLGSSSSSSFSRFRHVQQDGQARNSSIPTEL